MKYLVKTVTCRGNYKHEINIAFTFIVPDKKKKKIICIKDVVSHLIFMKLLRGYSDCYHPQGPARVTLYYHIKALLGKHHFEMHKIWENKNSP